MRKLIFLIAVLSAPLFVTACGVTHKTKSTDTTIKDVALTVKADTKALETATTTTVVTETANTFYDVPVVTLDGFSTLDNIVLKPLEVQNSDLSLLVTVNSDKKLVATVKTLPKRLPITIDRKTVTNENKVADVTDKTVTNVIRKDETIKTVAEVKRSRVGWNTLLGAIGFTALLAILIVGWRYIRS